MVRDPGALGGPVTGGPGRLGPGLRGFHVLSGGAASAQSLALAVEVARGLLVGRLGR